MTRSREGYLQAATVRACLFAAFAAMASPGWVMSIWAGELPGEPAAVLRGEGDSELAPHGEGNVYAPDVIQERNMLRMWYGGQGKDGHDRIAYAESANGKDWVRKGVVLKDDKANHVNDPSVVKVGNTFYMYFTRTEKDVVDRIDFAVSQDGLKWTPRGVALAPGQQGSWDSLSVGRPSVVHEDGVFKMWYDGRKDFPPGSPVNGVPTSPTSRRSVGYATSKDGVSWTRHQDNPVYGNDAGAVDVTHVGTSYIMLYESRAGTRIATSKEGIKWGNDQLFLKTSGSKMDAFGHVTPFLLYDPNKKMHRLFVGAAGASTWDHNQIALFEITDQRLTELTSGQE